MCKLTMYSKIFEVSDEDTYMLVCRTIGELLNDGEVRGDAWDMGQWYWQDNPSKGADEVL